QPLTDINFYPYVQNTPIMATDPTGTLTIHGDRMIPNDSHLSPNVKCGDPLVWVRWDFVLDQKAKCDGYFVQHIETWCDVDPMCKNCPTRTTIGPLIISPFIPAPIQWYEALPVRKGDRYWDGRFNGLRGWNYTDEASANQVPNACARVIQRGTVKFFC